MTLNPHPSYPSQRSYVLKLGPDARPADGLISGRLEHINSGDSFEFDSAAALLALLQAHVAAAALVDPEPPA